MSSISEHLDSAADRDTAEHSDIAEASSPCEDIDPFENHGASESLDVSDGFRLSDEDESEDASANSVVLVGSRWAAEVDRRLDLAAEESEKRQVMGLAALEDTNSLQHLRNFQNLTLTFGFCFDEHDEATILLKIVEHLITTFNHENALTTLKFVRGIGCYEDLVSEDYDRVNNDDDRDVEFAGPLCKSLDPLYQLPKTTKLELAAFPEHVRQKAREAIGRPVSFTPASIEKEGMEGDEAEGGREVTYIEEGSWEATQE